jgi:hypothetical protein
MSELAKSRFVSVRVCDTSGKDLLRVAHLVQIKYGSAFHDIRSMLSRLQRADAAHDAAAFKSG